MLQRQQAQRPKTEQQQLRNLTAEQTKTSSIHLDHSVSQKIQNQTKLQRQQAQRPKTEQQQPRSRLTKETKTSSIHLDQNARQEIKN